MTTSPPEAKESNKRQKLASSSIVELNVGGRYFSTTKETLLQYGSSYFERLLADVSDSTEDDDERNKIVVRGANRDKDGRLYIDKDPDLFKLVLDFMRNTLDPDDLTTKERKQLTKEALYYDLGSLYAELTRPPKTGYDEDCLSEEDQIIRNEAQAIREQLKNGVYDAHAEADQMLIDVFSPPHENERPVLENAFERPLTSLNATILFQTKVEEERSRIGLNVAKTTDEFKQRMIQFGGPFMDDFPFHKNLIVAGGSVLKMLLHEPDDERMSDSDIDLFLVAPTPEDGIEAYNAIIQHLSNVDIRTNSTRQQHLHGGRSRNVTVGHNELFVMRSPYAVTFCVCYPQRHLQLILVQHPCIASVLFNFDIDCCQVAWDANNNKVWATSSAIRAIQTGVNFADPERCNSMEYELRLLKYVNCGFMVAVPGLDMRRVNDFLLRNWCYAYDHGELCRLHLDFRTNKDMPEISSNTYQPVRGLAKLIVASTVGNGNFFLGHQYLFKGTYCGRWKKPTPPNDPPSCLCWSTDISVGRHTDSAGEKLMPWKDVKPYDILTLILSHQDRRMQSHNGVSRRTCVYDYTDDISVDNDTPNVCDGKQQFPNYPFVANETIGSDSSALCRYLKFDHSTSEQFLSKPFPQEEWTKGVYKDQ